MTRWEATHLACTPAETPQPGGLGKQSISQPARPLSRGLPEPMGHRPPRCLLPGMGTWYFSRAQQPTVRAPFAKPSTPDPPAWL